MKLAICDNCASVFDAEGFVLKFREIPGYNVRVAECPNCQCSIDEPEGEILDNSERIERLEQRLEELETKIKSLSYRCA